jgi:putative MATE family efflux protein
LIARAWGAGDRREAAHVLTAAVMLAVALTLAATVVGFVFAENIAGVFGLDPVTSAAATVNIRWFSCFIIGMAMNIIITGALRATGDVWTPLMFVGAVNVINIPLLYIFVFGAWGMPRMGSAGAPFASGLAFTLGGLVLVGAWMTQKLSVPFDLKQWQLRDRYRRLIRIGYPAALEQVVLQSGMFAFLALIGHYYGTEAFAAYAVGINLLNVAIVVGFGFSVAGSTLVGQHLGAGDFDAARRSGWRALMFAAGSMGVLALLTAVYAEGLARFFLGEQELTVRYTVTFTYIMASMLPLLGLEFAIGGALRGAGDTRFPLMTTFLALVFARLGLAILFVRMGLPVGWVYGTMIAEYLFKAGMLTWRFQSGRWQYAVPGRLARA